MERAHVIVRLRGEDHDNNASNNTHNSDDPSPVNRHGVRRTSATTARLEHSEMSPGVASISFEHVFDQEHSTADVFEQATALTTAIDRVVDGQAVMLVATGASDSGKSFSMHGSFDGKVPGLIELAINRIFDLVADGTDDDWRVLLATVCTHDDGSTVVDSLNGSECSHSHNSQSADARFLERALRVDSRTEAMEAYRSALEQSRAHIHSDFVCVLYVETRDSVVHRGRLVLVDIHGTRIIEPVDQMSSSMEQQQHASTPTKLPLFIDTQFPKHETLTQWCGPFIGGDSTTFFLVTIHKAATRQQQAIQSLLYACKAKEIRSQVGVIHTATEFTPRPWFHSLSRSKSTCDELDKEPSPPDSPVSRRLSDFMVHTPRSASDLLTERLRQAYHSAKKASLKPVASSPVSFSPSRSERRGVSIQAIHTQADALLASTCAPSELETMSLTEKLDAITKRIGTLEKRLEHEASVKQKCVDRISKLSQTMSFQVVEHEKQVQAKEAQNQQLQLQLEMMQSKYDDAEQTLETLQVQVEAMKLATRERGKSPRKSTASSNTTERLLLQQFSARLETAMMEAKAVVDHKDACIRELETKLAQTQASCNEWETKCRQEIDAFKAERAAWVNEKRQLEARASRCQQEQVQWDQVQQENAELGKQLNNVRCEMEQTTARWTAERQEWTAERSQWEDDRNTWQQQRDKLTSQVDQYRHRLEAVKYSLAEAKEQLSQQETDWRERLRALENDAAQKAQHYQQREQALEEQLKHTRVEVKKRADDQGEWQERMRLLETELATVRQSLVDQESLVSSQQQTITELQQRLELESSHVETIQQLELRLQARDDELNTVRAQWESSTVSDAGRIHELTSQIEDLQRSAAKDKKTMEKKLRALMLERKQQLEDAERLEEDMAQQVQRLNLALEAEHHERDRLQHSLGDLEQRCEEAERERAVAQEQILALQDCVHQLESAKQELTVEFEERTYNLEQKAARAVLERETQLLAESEHKLRDLMERHAAELLQRDLELRRLRSRQRQQAAVVAPPVSSPLSSPSSSSSGGSLMAPGQRDLDELHAAVNGDGRSPNGKTKQDKKVAKLKDNVAALRQQVTALTHALAVANEQETLAKDAIEQHGEHYQRMMYAQEELLHQVNLVKQENWVLCFALDVTERRRRPSLSPPVQPCARIQQLEC